MKKNILIPLIILISFSFSAVADIEKGKKLFGERCASCHGAQGAGDGPVAASLPPEMKPRNLQSPERKYATDDVKLLELLKKGGANFGLSPMMPGQPDLNDADLNSIVAFLKTLKK